MLDDGRLCYRIKDTHQVRLMTPVQFLARLAALVPPPRHPLLRSARSAASAHLAAAEADALLELDYRSDSFDDGMSPRSKAAACPVVQA